MDAALRFLDDQRASTICDELAEFVGDSVGQHRPGARRRRAARVRMGGVAARARRSDSRGDLGHAAASGGVRSLGWRARRADRPHLRPLRRAAARSHRRLGLAAVRADRAQRPPLRPRRQRRQSVDADSRSSPPKRASRRATPPPVNLRFLFEAEEEIGSPSLPALVRERRDALACDVVLSADGGMWRAERPSLNLSARGIGGARVHGARPGQGSALGPARRRRGESAPRGRGAGRIAPRSRRTHRGRGFL